MIDLTIAQHIVEGNKQYRIGDCRRILIQLESDLLILKNMKNNESYGAFEKRILEKESYLTLLMENLDLLQQVHRNWRHIQSIFKSDLAKQLVKEIDTF